MLPLRRGPV